MIYNDFWGLKESPFQLTPDTQYFFDNPAHLEALNTLLVAIKSGEGFVKVSGEVGTGKTLLSRKLMRIIGHHYTMAYIPNPYLSPTDLQRALAEEIGIPSKVHNNPHTLLNAINKKLTTLQQQGKPVVFMIDEAQALPQETLESMRLLTNLETEKSKLLQVILFGQPELEDTLNQYSLRQLKQRITFSYRLEPMGLNMVGYYIDHRLQTAGFTGASVFCPRAKKRIAKYSKGIPRLINILAHKSLMAAYGQKSGKVTVKHVNAAIKDTESVETQHFWPRSLAIYGFSASVCIALASSIFMLRT